MITTGLVNVTFLGVFILFGTLGNALIMIVYGVKKRRKISTDYFIVALAAVDFVAVFLLMYSIIISVDPRLLTTFACKFAMFIRRSAAVSSITLTALTACDRYVVLNRPFRLRSSSKRSVIIIVSGIAYSIISQLFWPIYAIALDTDNSRICAYTGPNWLGMMNGINIIIIYGLSTIVCAVLYAKIYLKIKRHKEKIRHLKQGPKPSRNRALDVAGPMDDESKKSDTSSKKNVVKKKNLIHPVDKTPNDFRLDKRVKDTTGTTSGLGSDIAADFSYEGTSTAIRTISKSSMGHSPKLHHVGYKSAPIRSPSPSGEGTRRCYLPTVILNQNGERETACNSNLCFIDSNDVGSNQERHVRKIQVQPIEKSSPGFQDNVVPEQESDKADSPCSTTRGLSKRMTLPGNVHSEIQESPTRQKNQLQPQIAVTASSSTSVIKPVVSPTGGAVRRERPGPLVQGNERRDPNGNGKQKPRELDVMTKMLLIATTIFFLTTLPAVCVENTPAHILNEFQGTKLGEYTLIFVILSRFINHFVNVFIYGLVNASFRKEALKVFSRGN